MPQESPETFQRLCGEYTRHFNPQNEVGRDLVYEAVSCMWRIIRIQSAESSLIEIEISRQRHEVDRKFINPDDWVRLAMAFENLANNGRALALMSRYESRMMRAKDRAMEQLRKLRADPQPDDPEDDEPDENLPNEPERAPEPGNEKMPNEPDTTPEISTDPVQNQGDAIADTAPECARNKPGERPALPAPIPAARPGISDSVCRDIRDAAPPSDPQSRILGGNKTSRSESYGSGQQSEPGRGDAPRSVTYPKVRKIGVDPFGSGGLALPSR